MKLEYKKFKKWLETKAAAAIVGRKRDNCGCPLANFHSAASGGWEVVISSDMQNGFGYVIDRGSGDRKLPAWADAFAFSVDGDGEGQITAARALEILATISP